MGHVDHGKTTLLDRLRNASVAASEAGGITQHIGAFSVELRGESITFLDTPGHAAFSSIRERGTRVTDIVVLVIAAEDGIMAQTIESIKLAKDYNTPLVIAINKCDKTGLGSTIKRIHQELTRHQVIVEELGGSIQSVPISALTGLNIERLLDSLLAQAEIMDLKGDTEGLASGVILESKVKVGLGNAASLIVQNGRLAPGAILVANEAYCKVKTLTDHRGRILLQAGPSIPVEVTGWKTLPPVGFDFSEFSSDKEAFKTIESKLRERLDLDALSTLQEIRIREGLHEKLLHLANSRTKSNLASSVATEPPKSVFYYEQVLDSKDRLPELLLIVKCIAIWNNWQFLNLHPFTIVGDVIGSLEAIQMALAQLPKTKVLTRIVSSGVGPLTESDIDVAKTTKATIVTFNVKTSKTIQKYSDTNKVEILQFNIIYALLDELKKRLINLIPRIWEEKIVGRAKVLEIFHIKDGKQIDAVAGCMVEDGSINKGSIGTSGEKAEYCIEVHRESPDRVQSLGRKSSASDPIIFKGKIRTMRHGKRDITVAGKGMEFGVSLENFASLEPNDILINVVKTAKLDTLE